jgi:RNA polymerase sigma-70 factor (sigma-E family)
VWLGQLDPAFERFVQERSTALLRTACLLVGDRQHAEDLLQLALVRTARRWRVARDRPEAYVRRVLVNLSHDRRRALLRRPREAFAPSPPETPVADGVAALADRDALLHALRSLPHQQRAAVVLRFWEDLSVAETADALGCAEGTVKSNTARGLERLRALLLADATVDH